MIRLLNILFPVRTDLEIVLKKIADQECIRNADLVLSNLDGNLKNIDLDKNLRFLIGRVRRTSYGLSFNSFTVKFGQRESKCIVTMQGNDEPLFLFDDPEEVKQIRGAIKNKYNDILKKKQKDFRHDFDNV